ncbi:hypothetical protein JTB14_016780 [Gonioctena quinquepunctata]|nr:hypothetical protein JTB14_016780 [Gonioctena quinquepunctata]
MDEEVPPVNDPILLPEINMENGRVDNSEQNPEIGDSEGLSSPEPSPSFRIANLERSNIIEQQDDTRESSRNFDFEGVKRFNIHIYSRGGLNRHTEHSPQNSEKPANSYLSTQQLFPEKPVENNRVTRLRGRYEPKEHQSDLFVGNRGDFHSHSSEPIRDRKVNFITHNSSIRFQDEIEDETYKHKNHSRDNSHGTKSSSNFSTRMGTYSWTPRC